MMSNQLVCEFSKNTREKVQIQLNNYKGNDLIDIRVYYNVNNDETEWLPTRKGITVRVDPLAGATRGASESPREAPGVNGLGPVDT